MAHRVVRGTATLRQLFRAKRPQPEHRGTDANDPFLPWCRVATPVWPYVPAQLPNLGFPGKLRVRRTRRGANQTAAPAGATAIFTAAHALVGFTGARDWPRRAGSACARTAGAGRHRTP